jgi:hypothetical protein
MEQHDDRTDQFIIGNDIAEAFHEFERSSANGMSVENARDL